MKLKIKELEKKIRSPNYSDLMRDNLRLLKVDFLNPKVPDYLEGLNESEKKEALVNATELSKNPMFKKISEYLINVQGNYILKEAVNDAQIYAGRFTINGVTLFIKEVDRCRMLFEDMNTKEDFNPLEIIGNK